MREREREDIDYDDQVKLKTKDRKIERKETNKSTCHVLCCLIGKKTITATTKISSLGLLKLCQRSSQSS